MAAAVCRLVGVLEIEKRANAAPNVVGPGSRSRYGAWPPGSSTRSVPSWAAIHSVALRIAVPRVSSPALTTIRHEGAASAPAGGRYVPNGQGRDASAATIRAASRYGLPRKRRLRSLGWSLCGASGATGGKSATTRPGHDARKQTPARAERPTHAEGSSWEKIREKSPASSPRNADMQAFLGLVEADDGARTHDLLHGKDCSRTDRNRQRPPFGFAKRAPLRLNRHRVTSGDART